MIHYLLENLPSLLRTIRGSDSLVSKDFDMLPTRSCPRALQRRLRQFLLFHMKQLQVNKETKKCFARAITET